MKKRYKSREFKDDMKAADRPVKKTGTFKGKSNKLGHGGRAAQLKASGKK